MIYRCWSMGKLHVPVRMRWVAFSYATELRYYPEDSLSQSSFPSHSDTPLYMVNDGQDGRPMQPIGNTFQRSSDTV
jgi:hypothetical protein